MRGKRYGGVERAILLVQWLQVHARKRASTDGQEADLFYLGQMSTYDRVIEYLSDNSNMFTDVDLAVAIERMTSELAVVEAR